MSPLARALLGVSLATALLVALGFGLTRDARVLPTVSVGKPAPPFDLETLDGRPVALAELKGKPTVINFWASWCTECEKEHPLFLEANARLGDRVNFVGIVFQDSAGNASRFLVDMGDGKYGSYPNLLDPGSRAAIDFGVYGVPETFFLDREGMIVAKRVGRVTADLLVRELRRIMR